MTTAEHSASPEERVASGLRRCPRAVLTIGDGPAEHVAGVNLVAPDPETATVVVAIDGRIAPETSASVELECFDSLVCHAIADSVLRGVIRLSGTVLVPEVPVQRRLAIDVAREQPDPTLLTVGTASSMGIMTPTSVVLTDSTGVCDVPVDQFFSAGPDPFAELEGMWVAHFNDPRCPVVDKLAERLGRRRFAYRPLVTALDRFGLTLSEFGPEGGRSDLRLSFDDDCVDVADLGQQIRLLMGCPRSARPLRARQTDGGRGSLGTVREQPARRRK